ncbi:hypothetical protein CCAX7_11930 [Capsulimonas corticalis]|uniref:Uncharacterized protein n=1 Tax=Capsulimonas corticalis TaxID=2219043 RepID=A0A402D4I9_9BACT|nr:tetratricopeptide repeat protein [Capsulimonas corticalis]BDI29142.1 hypothetical protein CCAX7_11930 [Capsulimonas corticalis]
MRSSTPTLVSLILLMSMAAAPVLADDAQTHLQKAKVAAAQQNWDAALTELDATIAIDKNNIEAHSGRAMMLVKKQDLQGAITEIGRVLEIDPKNADAYSVRSALYQQTGDKAKAKDDYIAFLRLSPAEADKLQAAAQAAADKQDWANAANLWSLVTEVRPGDAKAHYALGMVLKNSYYTVFMNSSGQPNFQENLDKLKADTKASFDAAIKADPKFAPAYLAQDDPEAIAQGLKQMPDNAELLVARAQMSLTGIPSDDIIKAALSDYDHAIKVDPKNANAFTSRAGAYLWAKKYDLALADTKRALELKPNDYETIVLRGLLYGDLYDYAHQAAENERALAIKPNDTVTSYNYFTALTHLPEKARALPIISKLIDGEPASVLYLSSRAQLYFDLKEYGKAAADVDKVLTIEADNKQALDLKTKIAAAQK